MSVFRPKAALFAAAMASVLLASGCANSYDVVALTGTVESVRNGQADNTYHIYKIRRHDDMLVEVPAFANVTAGTCVDVLVSSRKAKTQPDWTASDITLRQTNTCPSHDTLAQSGATPPSH